MKVKTIALATAGNSQWVPVDTKMANFVVGVNVNAQAGGTYSYKVQAGFTDVSTDVIPMFSVTRSGTTATLVFPAGPNQASGQAQPGHGLKVGDSLVLFGDVAPFLGTFDVGAVTDSHTVTITVANSGPTVAGAGLKVRKIYVEDTTQFPAASTASLMGSIVIPCSMLRINAATITTGQLNMTIAQGQNQ